MVAEARRAMNERSRMKWLSMRQSIDVGIVPR